MDSLRRRIDYFFVGFLAWALASKEGLFAVIFAVLCLTIEYLRKTPPTSRESQPRGVPIEGAA